MRIATFMPRLTPVSLGWVVYRDLAAAMAKRGEDFRYVVTVPSGRGDGSLPGAVELPLSRGWLRAGALAAPALRVRDFPAIVAALTRFLRREGHDLDVLQVEIAYPLGAAAAFAAALARWKGFLAITPMGEDVLVCEDASYGFRRFPVPRRLVARTLSRAGAIRCISPLVHRLVRGEWPDVPARMIPLNVAAEAVALAHESPASRAERRRTARQRLLLRYQIGERPLVLSLGRLHPFKGIDVLVDALPDVPNAHLMIVGPSLAVRPFGDTAAALAARAERRGVADRVTLTGAVPPSEVLDLLAGADVVAVPSRLESLNKVCVEAAAVGTPFVVTESTGISEFVPENALGRKVPARDPTILAASLREVLDRHWQPEARSAAEFVTAFAPETVADGLLEMYRSTPKPRESARR